MSRRKDLRQHRKARRQRPKNWCCVYVLKEHVDGPPVYVGQTRQLPQERLWWHIKEVARRIQAHESLSPVQRWLAARLPNAPVIEVIDAEGTWDISEAVWIDRYVTVGHALFNVLSRVPQGKLA